MGELNVESRSLFIADNLEVLRGINSECIDLIATDPPFNKSVKAFQGITTAGTDAEGRRVSYKDVWTWANDVQGGWTESIRQDHPNLYAVIRAANAAAGEDMGAYLCWLGVRVLEMHRILKPTGSMYLHIDHTANAYAKAMMDAIFSRKNFRNEIVWRRMGAHNDYSQGARHFGRVHDTLLRYSKGKNPTCNVVHEPYSKEYIEKTYRYKEPDGRRYQIQPLHAAKPGGDTSYEWKGRKPPQGRYWAYSKANMKLMDTEGRIYYSKTGNPSYKIYLDESKGRTLQDLWDDISPIHRKRNEKTGYPTQKPLALYERIIKASSNPGDIVLDPFAGCATTCVAAERLGRSWIGIDVNEPARTVILDRLKYEVVSAMNWNDTISTPTDPPVRTDRGGDAAPELILVSPQPKAGHYSARELRRRLILEAGMKCQGCGWVPHHEEYLEVDHRVPKSLGGKDSLNNRVLLCSPCNSAMGNRLTLRELRERRLQENRMADANWDQAWLERVGKFG